MTVREMREEDAPTVASLSGQLGYTITPDQVRDRFALISCLPDTALFVAEDETGTVVGWAHVYIEHLLEWTDSYAEIGGLVVSERARRQGVGQALMQAAEAWAVRHGYPDVRVRSGTARAGAHAFYESLGYERVKTQVRFRKRLG